MGLPNTRIGLLNIRIRSVERQIGLSDIRIRVSDLEMGTDNYHRCS